jgi:hypothetical protein
MCVRFVATSLSDVFDCDRCDGRRRRRFESDTEAGNQMVGAGLGASDFAPDGRPKGAELTLCDAQKTRPRRILAIITTWQKHDPGSELSLPHVNVWN